MHIETRLPCHSITCSRVLQQRVDVWLQLPEVALDTEFMRTNTYYPLPALIQINDGQANYLIDPLALTDLTPLQQLLAAPQVTKILHACSEDLEVFQRLCGQLPNPIFDTQIAAALLGQGFSIGYARLVEQQLGVQLPKDETRSDWLARPLSASQQHYAALDVDFLLPLAIKQKQQLIQLNRLQWLTEDCQQLRLNYADNQNPDTSHSRLKNAWKFSRREQALLQALSSWRETQAQHLNLPRNHLLKEESLYALAEYKPKHLSQLHKTQGLSERFIKKQGQTLLNLIAEILQLPEDQLPPAQPRPLTPVQNQQVKRMREWVEAKALELHLAPEILARKKDYEYLARLPSNLPPPAVLNGWRRDIIGAPLLQAFI